MDIHYAEHLSKIKKIKLGGYYTPKSIVELVHNIIKPYLNKKIVIFDNAGGCGSFLFGLERYNYRIADYDKSSCDFLKTKFDNKNIFNTNSLLNISREKYHIRENDFLIMIGNLPYNDTISEISY